MSALCSTFIAQPYQLEEKLMKKMLEAQMNEMQKQTWLNTSSVAAICVDARNLQVYLTIIYC